MSCSIYRIFCVLLFAVMVSASGCRKNDDEPKLVVFNTDETFLIDTYVRIKRARSHYPDHPEVAESLFAIIETNADSVRVARALAAINNTPERWKLVFEEIETQLRTIDPDSALKRSDS